MDMIFEVRNVSKRFPGVQALDSVNFVLKKGTIHALVGENGAGKTTFVNIISGIIRPDKGDIYLKGKKVRVNTPAQARMLGISLVPQILNLCQDITVAENIYMGQEQKFMHKGLIDWKSINISANRLLKDELGVDIDVTKKVMGLTVAEQQFVEIAKALSFESSVLILDEPTATLTEPEKERLFKVLRKLVDKEKAIIYISHRLDEVFEIADIYMVLRNGRVVGTGSVSDITKEKLVTMIVGETVKTLSRKSLVQKPNKKCVLEMRNVSFDGVRDLSFCLREGEILGIAGLIGSGKSVVAHLLFGINTPDTGQIKIMGEPVVLSSPNNAMRLGIGFVPADRLHQAMFLHRSVLENITIANLKRFKRFGLIKVGKEKEKAHEVSQRLEIKMSSIREDVMYLSGGNQQKVSIARWISRTPRIIILEEPTQGIDVKAKAQVREIMLSLQEQGISVIAISSDVDEIISVCDRVIVMFDGRITSILEGGEVIKDLVSRAELGRYKNVV